MNLSAAVVRGFNMAGNEQSSQAELFILVNAIRETRRRCFNMQMALHHLVARRRQVLNVSLLFLLLISSQRDNIATVPRSCRRLGRNTGWWDTVWNTYSNARFKKTFRISRSTFKFILNRIGPFLQLLLRSQSLQRCDLPFLCIPSLKWPG